MQKRENQRIMRKQETEEIRKKLRRVDANLGEDIHLSQLKFNPETVTQAFREKLRKQLEFYLGDSNLTRDSYLRDMILKS